MDGFTTFFAASASHADLMKIINEEARNGGPRLAYIYDRHIEPVASALRPIFNGLVATGRIRAVRFEAMMYASITMTEALSGTALVSLLGLSERHQTGELADDLTGVFLSGLLTASDDAPGSR